MKTNLTTSIYLTANPMVPLAITKIMLIVMMFPLLYPRMAQNLEWNNSNSPVALNHYSFTFKLTWICSGLLTSLRTTTTAAEAKQCHHDCCCCCISLIESRQRDHEWQWRLHRLSTGYPSIAAAAGLVWL